MDERKKIAKYMRRTKNLKIPGTDLTWGDPGDSGFIRKVYLAEFPSIEKSTILRMSPPYFFRGHLVRVYFCKEKV